MQFNELDVNLDFLQLDNDSSTRVVNVDRDQLGDRFFRFEESSYSCFADEVLSKKLIEKEILNLEIFSRNTIFGNGYDLISISNIRDYFFFLLNRLQRWKSK